MQKDDAKCQRDENASVGARVAGLVHVRFSTFGVHRCRKYLAVFTSYVILDRVVDGTESLQESVS
jgi:hypothetical protein